LYILLLLLLLLMQGLDDRAVDDPAGVE